MAGLNRTSVFVFFGGVRTDVTGFVDSVNIRRGRSRELDTFPNGSANIVFRNEERTFDPLFRDGPYFGKIKPRQQIEVLFDDIPIFVGVVDDWNLDFSLNNTSTATAICIDGLALLSQTAIDSFTNSQQIPGDRIQSIISRTEVDYRGPVDLDPGLNPLQGDTVQADANTLNYLQTVADTDVGRLFVDGAGVLRYRDRTSGIVQNPRIVLADNSEYIQQLSLLSNAVLWFDASSPQPIRVDADAQAQWILQDSVLWFDASDPDYLPPVLGFSGIEVDFGTEFLYNRISVSSVGQGKVTAVIQASIDEYGVRTLSKDGYLFLDQSATTDFAEFLASIYSEPVVRISQQSVLMHGLSDTLAHYVARVEIGDVVRTIWTPNRVSDVVDLDSIVEGVEHRIDKIGHMVTFQLTPRPTGGFILDDPNRGLLDTSELTY
jgi:hypothetical protein